MREGRAAVVLQRTEHWIGVDLIAGAGQHTAAVVAGKVVTKRGERANAFDGSTGSASIQDRISHLHRSSAVVPDSTARRGRVAIKRAIFDD